MVNCQSDCSTLGLCIQSLHCHAPLQAYSSREFTPSCVDQTENGFPFFVVTQRQKYLLHLWGVHYTLMANSVIQGWVSKMGHTVVNPLAFLIYCKSDKLQLNSWFWGGLLVWLSMITTTTPSWCTHGFNRILFSNWDWCPTISCT